MKKSTFIFSVLVLILLASCSQNMVDESVGTVSFTTGVSSRGIIASIDYPAVMDKTWKITAVKTDGGADLGAGIYEDFLLTDVLGTFSTGAWSFALEGYDGQTLVFEGSVSYTVRAGNNLIPVTVHTAGAKGTLSVEGCNFLLSQKGCVTRVYLKLDNTDAQTWSMSTLTSEDGDFYELPTFTKKLDKGVHIMYLRFMFEGDTWEDTEPVSFRIDSQAITRLSIGIQEVQLGISVTIETVDALVVEDPEP